MSDWAACLSEGEPPEGRTTNVEPYGGIPGRGANAFAALRLIPDILYAELGGVCWLRGPSLDDALEHQLRQISGLIRFDLLPGEKLRPAGSRLADRTLPRLAWRPLNQAVVPSLPPAALGGQTTQKVSLRLVRTNDEQPAAALALSLEQWTEFSTAAAAVRLARLRFAASEYREVLVLGQPLPPVPGRRYASNEGILVPCGFCWSPAVEAAVLRQVFELRGGDVVLLAADNTHQVIRAEQFVPASRSAVRNTLSDWDHAGHL